MHARPLPSAAPACGALTGPARRSGTVCCSWAAARLLAEPILHPNEQDGPQQFRPCRHRLLSATAAEEETSQAKLRSENKRTASLQLEKLLDYRSLPNPGVLADCLVDKLLVSFGQHASGQELLTIDKLSQLLSVTVPPFPFSSTRYS